MNRGCYDLVTKSAKYAVSGLPHYWILDPRDHAIAAFTLVDGIYRQVAEVAEGTAELDFGIATARIDVDALLAE